MGLDHLGWISGSAGASKLICRSLIDPQTYSRAEETEHPVLKREKRHRMCVELFGQVRATFVHSLSEIALHQVLN